VSCKYEHTAYNREGDNLLALHCEDGSNADRIGSDGEPETGKQIAVLAYKTIPYSSVIELWFKTEMQRHHEEERANDSTT
jgi:hypothetical protein